MTDAFFIPDGESVEEGLLVIPHARELASHLTRQINPYARLIETRVAGNARQRIETVVFDVDVELSQITDCEIQPLERVSVSFTARNDSWPEVLALRKEFPVVPHLNLRQVEFPRSICLYAEPYLEGRLRWTVVSIVERIRDWLRDTAQGVLHNRDQPLEPLFLGTRNTVVLPPDINARTALGPTQLRIARIDRMPWGEVYIADYLAGGIQGQGGGFVAATYVCPPILHGVINWIPQTLLDLQSAVVAARGDLLTNLRDQVCSWPRDSGLLACHLVLIVFFPKLRDAANAVEALETRVFVTKPTVADIGEVLGVWQMENGVPGQLIAGTVDQQRLSQVALLPLNSVLALDRQRAAAMNGSVPDQRKITAIGMGALGSQIATLLVRSGFGAWSLIDGDVLLPHNLARHVLLKSQVGWPKADAMKVHLNETLAERMVEDTLFADVMNAGEKESDVGRLLEAADVILDFSASVPVARQLALAASAQGRRVSAFMNPSGSSSILLCEDSQRLVRLDSLEMQYYRALLCRTELAGHFGNAPGTVRYAASCRDVSSTLPAHQVALHAALTSAAIKNAVCAEDAAIHIWNTAEGGAVQSIQIPVEIMIERQIADWRLVTDHGLVEKMKYLRAAGLPRETGGVLVGVWDLHNRIVYAADAFQAPPDSKRNVTSFIRGCEELRDNVRRAGEAAGGMLQYIGEWHSHPDGFGTAPSDYDCKVFKWIAIKAAEDGYQPVMAIVGDLGARWFVGSISSQQRTDFNTAK